jgi:hypothetical protein
MNILLSRYKYLVSTILSLIIAFFVFIEIILALTPPIARDVLIHHLAIPKLWLKHGGFYDIPWAEFSYYPMNIDLLYLIPLYFGNDIIPNFIHMGFGIGTAFLIYHYLNKKIGQLAGLLGVVIFISTPIIVRMSTTAYVDLGLVFFTTASVLAFIRWRDKEYKEHRWLFISSMAMGFALGTKYNALIIWFFLSLAIVFVYSRDTGKQGKAISYGSFFFVVSLIIFSPWLIKNMILTGNPLYPLFKNVFDSNMANDSGAYSVVSGGSYMGMFKMRELLYGENIWEILLIPIRFFFQGQDNSARLFEGVLNPILIVAVPFAFMNRSKQADKLIFLFFSLFLIFAAFFLDQLRIRYFLPVVPFLVILTVTGLINIFTWVADRARPFRELYICGLLIILTSLAAKNVIYLNNYFQSIQPVNYILNKESKDEFITRHDRSYPAMMYINKHTPENARIKLILLAGRGYYLERIYEEDPSSGMDTIRGLVTASSNDKTFQNYLNSLGCSHMLIRYDLFRQFLHDNYSPATVNQISQRMGKFLEIVYNANGYAVFKLRTDYSSS